ncbi:MAG: TolC family protein [Bacteroidia bacterium]|nr:TolC family protein [Bacteroidia bacterium]
MRYKKAWSGVLFCLFAFISLSAQQPLSLAQAIEMGLEKNFDIRLGEARTDLAANNNTWGAAGRWPSIGLTINSNNRGSNVDNPASFLNGNFSNISGTGRVDLNWTLFEGFKVGITKEKLEQLEQLSEGNAALVVENSLQAIILGYYTVLLEKERMEVFRKNLKLSRDRFNYLDSKRELGSGTTFDLLQFKNAYLNDSSAVLLQTLNYRNSLRNLNLLLGQEPEKVWSLTQTLEANPQNWALSKLQESLAANNTNLKNQYLNLEILQKDIDIAKTSLYPRLDMNLGSSYTPNRFYRADLGAIIGKTFDYYANFTLSYTLFNGGNIKRNIESTRLNQRLGQLTIQQMKFSLNSQLVSIYELYGTRKQLLGLSAASLETAALNLEMAEDKFKLGLINSFDYRDIQRAHLAAALLRLEAIYSLKDAEVQILRLTGGILDVKE